MEIEKNIILFVDDVPNSHSHCRSFIQEKRPDKIINLALDLDDAINLINKKRHSLYCAILDLSFGFPPLPKELMPIYTIHSQNKDKSTRPSDNYGQLIGEYLWEEKIPYLYLTAHMPRYQEEWEQGRNIKCLDKGVSEEEFIVALNETAESRNNLD